MGGGKLFESLRQDHVFIRNWSYHKSKYISKVCGRSRTKTRNK